MLNINPLKNTLVFLLFLLFGGVVTLRLGQDINFDLKNYHFYNAWAYLNNRYDHDLSPAQLQTYLNPFLDLIYYKLVVILNDPMLVTFILGLWYGLFAWATFRVLSLLQPTQNTVITLAGTLLGVSGVAVIGQAGTTTHEVTTAALMMSSFMLCITGLQAQNAHRYRFIRLAGLITGISVGFKLTTVSFAIALVCGITLLTFLNRQKYPVSILVNFIAVSAFGFLLTGGYWHYFLWHHYSSPFFPFYNGFFQSPYYENISLAISPWRATTLEKLLAYPFELSQINRPIKEEMFSDPRLLIGFISAFLLFIINTIKLIKSRSSYHYSFFNLNNNIAVLMFSSIWLIAYLLWAYLHGIYRYTIFLESLSAILFVILLYECRLHTRWIALIMVCMTLFTIHYTTYLSWGRIKYGLNTFEVHPPAINEKALVVMLSGRPMSYVIPFFPKETRFVSPQNNFNAVKYTNKLQRQINQTIESWSGPLYVLAPRGYNFMQDEVLKKFSLNVEYAGDNACKPIVSNIDQDALQICGLKRE